MKCRRIIKNDKGNWDVIWFGSHGKNSNGTAQFYNVDNKHDNYADNQDAVADSLIQQLSVLKYELWYNYEFGMPIIDKVKYKGIIDAYIIQVILNNPNIIEIKGFYSKSDLHEYNCYTQILSKYGLIDLSL